MQVEQSTWTRASGWTPSREGPLAADLVFVFGNTDILMDGEAGARIQDAYPTATMVGCSTAGEIADRRVLDDSIVATAVRFERTRVVVAHVPVNGHGSTEEVGRAAARSLPPLGLVHVMVLSAGKSVNGSKLVAGLASVLPPSVQVTGGLAGDGARFAKTVVWSGEGPREDVVTAIGFYGEGLRVGFGSLGGWDPFGPERVVTRSAANVLSELDGRPALALYKTYLGEHSAGLPSTGLLFPLSIRTPDGRTFVRTILGVDEAANTLTFAGDIPQGAYARLMKANFDRLIDGAQGAAKTCLVSDEPPDLAILISCVGRKLVLGQRTEEEVEAVGGILGRGTTLAGFYSYGEICPTSPEANCELHNQTMTITTFSER